MVTPDAKRHAVAQAHRAIVSSVIVVVSYSQVEDLDNPNSTKDHCDGRPGRSAMLRQGLVPRPVLCRSYTTKRDHDRRDQAPRHGARTRRGGRRLAVILHRTWADGSEFRLGKGGHASGNGRMVKGLSVSV